MRIATRFMLILAGVLVLAGAVLVFLAMSRSHWKLSGLSTAKLVTNEYTVYDTFRDISIDSNSEDILIATSEDGKCRVEFIENELLKQTAEVKYVTL